MKLIDYLQQFKKPTREVFAERCGTSIGHMTNIAYGYKPCSPELAVAIEQVSGRAVTRQELRPHDWPRIWPELIGNAASVAA